MKPTLLLVLVCLAAHAAPSPFSRIWFEPNRGQAPAAAAFVARAPGARLSFTAGGVRIDSGSGPMRLEFPGASKSARFEPLDATGDRTGYFLGSDPARWTRDVPHYQRLAWRGVYPGIDVVFYGSEGRLEYDIVLAPGADPARVRLRLHGAAAPRLSAAGDLAAGPLLMQRPKVYQDPGRLIEARYRLRGTREIAFDLGAFDRTRPLTIDPVLQFAGYIGGERDDAVVAVTSKGDIVGVTSSSGFGTSSAVRSSKDVFVQMVNTNGYTSLVFCGGSGDDVPTSAVVSYAGVVVGGWTQSTDFGTPGSFGGTDGFILEINRQSAFSGFQVTRVGGSGDDRVLALAGNSGSLTFFTGDTTSTDLKINGQPVGTPFGGGTDVLLGTYYNYKVVELGTYGGSGDESGYAVAYEGYRVSVAGRTTSPDLPLKDPLYAQLSGPSDAFLARFDNVNAVGEVNPPVVNFATYFGGSGDDEIRALAVSTSSGQTVVSFAGTTTSTDLPLLNPAQPQYGGGESDAFAGRLDSSTHALIYATYAGGSGRDEAAAIGINSVGDDIVAGTTSSPDLPVADPIQARLNGPRDAWYAVYAGGPLLSMSYFGGSGSETVLALSVSATDDVITIGGSTDSTDLPMPAITWKPSTPGGGVDGFTAQIGLPRVSPVGGTNVWLGKDLRTTVGILVSSAVAASGRLTLTSSDPSRVLAGLSSYADAQFYGSLSLPMSTVSRSQGYLYVALAGLADNGDADVTVAIDGSAVLTYHVHLRPTVLRPFYSTTAVSYFISQALPISPSVGVVDDDGRFSTANLSAGTSAPVVSYTVSDPAIATVSPATVDMGGSSSWAYLTPITAGSVDLTATCEGWTIFGPSTVTYQFVSSKLLAQTDVTIGKDLDSTVLVKVDRVALGVKVTATTDSPDKVCIVKSSGECAASNEFTLQAAPVDTVKLRALADSGTAVVRYASASAGEASFTVTLAPPKLALSTTAVQTPLSLTVGQTPVSRPVSFCPASGAGATCGSLRSGLSPAIAVASSDPSVAAVSAVDANHSYTITALKPGRVTLTATAPGFADAEPLDVVVAAPVPPALTVPKTTVLLGKDLQLAAVVSVTNGSTPVIRLRSSAPDLVVVSSDASKAGAAEVQAGYPYNFNLQALAGAGTATITASADGFPDAQFQVQLVPSGFAWSASAMAVYAYSTSSANLYSFALDPVSLAPVASESLRPGVTAAPTVVDGTGVALALKPTSGNYRNYTTGAPGIVTFSLVQPAGFTVPSLRNDLRVVVNPTVVAANIPTFMGKDLQSLVKIEGAGGFPVTVTGDDPSRLRISTDATTLGSGSLVVRPPAAIYLQALAGEGTANLRFTADGMQDAVFPVNLTNAVVLLQSYGPANLTTFSGDYSLPMSLSTGTPYGFPSSTGYTLRAGADPLDIAVTSTMPDVAKALVSNITFRPGATASANVSVRPIGPGDAYIVATPPPAFQGPLSTRQVAVHISKPSFNAGSVSVGAGLMTSLTPRLNENPPGAVLVTAVSSDPSRLLLSTSTDQPGSERIVFPFSGSSGRDTWIYCHGIAEGSAFITLTASTLNDARFDVTVTKPFITLGATQSSVYLGQPASLAVGLNGLLVRPGAPFVVSLTSSDPAVATVDSPVTISPGQYSASAKVRGVSAGKVTISVDGASAYDPNSHLSVALTVAPPPLQLGLNYSSYTLGNQMRGMINLGYSAPAVPLTIASSDGGKVLVSIDPKAAPQASITFTPSPSTPLLLYLHGMAASGSASLTFSAPGYASTTVTVNLCPSAFHFDRSIINAMRGTPYTFSVHVAPVASTELYNHVLRQEVPVAMEFSQYGIGSIKPATLVFKAGENQADVVFTPAATGSTILSLVTPAGFAATNPPSQMVVTVK